MEEDSVYSIYMLINKLNIFRESKFGRLIFRLFDSNEVCRTIYDFYVEKKYPSIISLIRNLLCNEYFIDQNKKINWSGILYKTLMILFKHHFLKTKFPSEYYNAGYIENLSVDKIFFGYKIDPSIINFVMKIGDKCRKGIKWVWIKKLVISLFSTDTTWNRFLIKLIYHLIDIVNEGRKLNGDICVIKGDIINEIVSHFVVLIKSYEGKTDVGYIYNKNIILKEIMRIGSEENRYFAEVLTTKF